MTRPPGQGREGFRSSAKTQSWAVGGKGTRQAPSAEGSTVPIGR